MLQWPQQEAERYVDAVVIGEVENIWTKVLKDFEDGCLSRDIKVLSLILAGPLSTAP